MARTLKRNKPLALLMTYSHPAAENRLKTQLGALLQLGFEVHTLGLGVEVVEGASVHFEIPRQSGIKHLVRRILVHAFSKYQNRFNRIRVPRDLVERIFKSKYEIVIAHDLELLPILTQSACGSDAVGDAIRHVDLHELHEFPDISRSHFRFFRRMYTLPVRRYHNWLLEQLSSPHLDLITVVNNSIGNWYVQSGYMKSFLEIRNCAPVLEMEFEPRKQPSIRFLYHGRFDSNRGLDTIVRASKAMRPLDELYFMLTGDSVEISRFKQTSLEVNPSVKFIPPVPMNQVSEFIRSFDVEIIFFAPVTQNLFYTLPNKFFEGIQARLALLSGPSPELARHIDLLGNGVLAEGFDQIHLEKLFASFTRDSVEKMRWKSHEAAQLINIATEAEKLKLAWAELSSRSAKGPSK